MVQMGRLACAMRARVEALDILDLAVVDLADVPWVLLALLDALRGVLARPGRLVLDARELPDAGVIPRPFGGTALEQEVQLAALSLALPLPQGPVPLPTT
jgi:hypothetical protein